MKIITLDGPHDSMSKNEVRSIGLEVLDLQTGETVDDANITHTPPEGGTVLTIERSPDHPYINMEFGPFGMPGWHYVNVQAVGSLGSKPETLYAIYVKDA
jgi:hypothetical protein